MMSFWVVPWSRAWSTPLSSAVTMYSASSQAAVALIVIDVFILSSGMPSSSCAHVALVGDGHADLADLAARELVVGVVAGLRRQVEGDRQAGLALGQVRAVQLVGLLRGRVTGVGPHHPRTVALGQAGALGRVIGHVRDSKGGWVQGRNSPGAGSLRANEHPRDRPRPLRRPAGHLLLCRCRGGLARRPRSRGLPRDAARGATGRLRRPDDPADPHPLRPRRRDRARC